MLRKKWAIDQEVYLEMVIGTLVYAVVFGFFNDYTNIVTATSFSIVFLAAIIMQALVYPTFLLKKQIVNWFTSQKTKASRYWMIFSIWFVLFVSKFIFLGALNFFLGEYIHISGFVGIVVVVVCATLITKLILLFSRLD